MTRLRTDDRHPVRRLASRSRAAVLLALAGAALAACAGRPGAAPAGEGAPPGPRPEGADRAPSPPVYQLYVANESSDVVSRVRFVPGRGATVEKSIEIGVMPGDLDGAHGLKVSPDGRHWYLTTAHGTPYGRIWKYRTGSDELLASETLGLFPATIAVSDDGTEAYVVNFNLHGDPEPSTVSVLYTRPVLVERTRIGTCVKPHGSRLGPAGRFHYSVCGPDDQLTEIWIRELRVSRTLELPETSAGASCSPTWAEPGVRGRHVYVACNGGSEVLEVARNVPGDGELPLDRPLEVARRFSTGPSPYNLEATPDGRHLVATNKGGSSISVVELESGKEAKRLPTSREVPHGVVSGPDGRYVFVSNEAAGATRSTVDVFDLKEMKRVASVEVRHQAGGIDFWRRIRWRRAASDTARR